MAAKEKYAVTGDQGWLIDGRMCEIKRELRQKGGSPLNPETVAYQLQIILDPARAAEFPRIIDEIEKEKTLAARELFISPERKLMIAIQRNAERGWGFSVQDFAALGEPPSWPEEPLGAVVLDVSLETVQQTFDEAWYFAAAVQPGSKRWNAVQSDEKHLQLLPGIQHQRGLRWQVVDLAANWDKQNGIRPIDICSPQTSPHSSIIWEASYSPRWVQAMDGKTVPFVWLPGYQLTVPGYRPWSFLPSLYWYRGYRRVKLVAGCADSRCCGWAVPALRE